MSLFSRWVTQSGESVVLTHGLLRALRSHPCVLADEVVCSFEERDPLGADDEPVRELELLLFVGIRRVEPSDFALVTTTIRPSDLFARTRS